MSRQTGMSTKTAFGVGVLVGELTYAFMRDVLHLILVPKIARRFL